MDSNVASDDVHSDYMLDISTMTDVITSIPLNVTGVTSWPPSVAGIVVLCFLVLVGMAGNIIIIITYLKSRQLRTPPNILYVNLALADLLFDFVTVHIISNLIVHNGANGFGATECLVQGIGLHVVTPSSYYSIASIAVCRYIIIVTPTRKRYMTWVVCTGVCVGCWLLPVIVLTPSYLGYGRYTWQPRMYVCMLDFGYSVVYDTVLFICGFGGVSVIMGFCYIRIYMTYRSSRRRVAAGAQNPNKRLGKEEFRLALQLLVVYALYNICWMPFSVLAMFYDMQASGSAWLNIIVVAFCITNSSINVFVYLYYNKTFRSECKKLFGLKPSNGNTRETSTDTRATQSEQI